MIAAWLADGVLTVRDDAERPQPLPGEVLVRVSCAGVCATDLELVRGYRPFRGVPGHEFSGTVVEGPPEWLGRRVVSEINVSCRSLPDSENGPCSACRANRPAHCDRRQVLGILGRDGAFAELVRVPGANLHEVPDVISDEEAVFVEPLAAAFRVLEQIELDGHEQVLVVGPGRLGQLVARTLALRVPGLRVAGRSRAPLERAAAYGLATLWIDEIEARAYDVAVDCTGHPDGFDIARRALRPQGTLIIKSTYCNDLTTSISCIVVDEIRVLGSRCGPFAPALEALSQGQIQVGDLIDDRFPLSEAPAAFSRAAERGVAKVLLVPPEAPAERV